jgi:hypothetical protein
VGHFLGVFSHLITMVGSPAFSLPYSVSYIYVGKDFFIIAWRAARIVLALALGVSHPVSSPSGETPRYGTQRTDRSGSLEFMVVHPAHPFAERFGMGV